MFSFVETFVITVSELIFTPVPERKYRVHVLPAEAPAMLLQFTLAVTAIVELAVINPAGIESAVEVAYKVPVVETTSLVLISVYLFEGKPRDKLPAPSVKMALLDAVPEPLKVSGHPFQLSLVKPKVVEVAWVKVYL